MENKHKPVLLQQLISYLDIKANGTYLDATLGGGGHSKGILSRLDNSGKLICFDVDLQACRNFTRYINEQRIGSEVKIINDNFAHLEKYKFNNLNGIIADLGFSTNQLNWVKGLSFLKNEELDMRLDKRLSVKARDLINGLYTKELEVLFLKYGDVSFAKKLAKEITVSRKVSPINNTLQLNKIIQKIVPFNLRKGDNKHPEAKVYQALRIAVNNELNSLQNFLTAALDSLCPGGRLAVISFHSGEDRIVKQFFQNSKKNNTAKMVIKILKPEQAEIEENNNSRSAKLRIIEKI